MKNPQEAQVARRNASDTWKDATTNLIMKAAFPGFENYDKKTKDDLHTHNLGPGSTHVFKPALQMAVKLAERKKEDWGLEPGDLDAFKKLVDSLKEQEQIWEIIGSCKVKFTHTEEASLLVVNFKPSVQAHRYGAH